MSLPFQCCLVVHIFLLLGGFGFDNCLPSLCTVCPEVEGLQVVLCIETSVASHVILVYPAIMVPQWQCP